MEDEELDYYAMYGVQKPEDEDTGGQEPEQEEVDLQEPDEDTEETPEGEDGEAEEPEESDDAHAPGADPDAAHRQELERVRQEGLAAVDAQVAAMGLRNPYDGNKPITTAAEYAAYQTAAREASVAELCRKAGITRKQFDELVAGDPEVRAAKHAKERAEAAERTAQEQQAAAQLDAEIAQIHKLCPEIKDRESLVAHKSWEKVRDRMKGTGCGVLDAFRLENFDELHQQSAQSVRRQAARNQRGKDHLKVTVGKGKGGVSVPSDVLREYKRYNPGATDAQIAAHYAKRHK